jgi:hypothetical protein
MAVGLEQKPHAPLRLVNPTRNGFRVAGNDNFERLQRRRARRPIADPRENRHRGRGPLPRRSPFHRSATKGEGFPQLPAKTNSLNFLRCRAAVSRCWSGPGRLAKSPS